LLALSFLGTVLLSMLVTVGDTLLLVPWLPEDSPGLTIAATLASTFIALGAMTAGGFVQWLPKDRGKRRRHLRTVILTTGSVQLVRVAGFVVCVTVVGAPPWIPLAVVAAGAVLRTMVVVAGSVAAVVAAVFLAIVGALEGWT
jgi:hypothetical protein